MIVYLHPVIGSLVFWVTVQVGNIYICMYEVCVQESQQEPTFSFKCASFVNCVQCVYCALENQKQSAQKSFFLKEVL